VAVVVHRGRTIAQTRVIPGRGIEVTITGQEPLIVRTWREAERLITQYKRGLS
jgi:hypothetical protein